MIFDILKATAPPLLIFYRFLVTLLHYCSLSRDVKQQNNPGLDIAPPARLRESSPNGITH